MKLSERLNTDARRQQAEDYLQERLRYNDDGVPIWDGHMNQANVPMAFLTIDGELIRVSARRLFYFLVLNHELPDNRNYHMQAGYPDRALAPLIDVNVDNTPII